MASQGDPVVAPRKRLTTFGKAAKRPPVAAPAAGFTPFAGDIWDPVDDAPAPVPSIAKMATMKGATTARTAAPARSPPPQTSKAQPARRVAEPKAKQPVRQYSRRATSKPPETSQSQPVPTTTAMDRGDEESQRAKKRKLTRTISARERSAGPYSTPESSPTGLRSPASGTESDPLPPGVKSPPSSQSTPGRDIVMQDSGHPHETLPFSAKTSRALDSLSISSKPTERNHIPLRLGRGPPARPVTSRPAMPHAAPQMMPQATALQAVSGASTASTASAAPPSKKRPQPSASIVAIKHQDKSSAAPRKKRLIDVLAEQAEEDSSSDDEVSEDGELAILGRRVPPALRSTPPPVIQPQPQSAMRVRQQTMGKKPGPKFTYGQQRTILAEPDPVLGGIGLGGSGDGLSKAPLFDFASLAATSTSNAFSFMDEDDDTANTGAVRTIHELRQAGANSRFGDEMDDIMDRISAPTAKPSSLRRGALLELAQKVQEKDFRRQFRNHGEGGLFKNVGQETDIIGGYAVVSALVTMFASSTSAHLVPQLCEQGIAALLTRFLAETSDIVVLSRDRKNNVSRNGQNTLAIVKSAILKLPIWEPTAPKTLPPRTLALKCLDLILRHATDPATEDDIFAPAVTDILFSVLSTSVSDAAYWDFPDQHESTDLYYTLSLLESHSVNAMQSQLGFKWTSQYVPIVADVLETALRRPADKFDQLESLTLRLTLNTTNNNSDAAGIFVNNGLLAGLAKTACGTFDVLLSSMKDGKFLPRTLESLIMMLGVMINFCEHYQPAAQSLDDADDGSPLNRLIRTFLDNCSTTSDADSMEKTQFNVAFAYLAILLGCLCLHDTIREKFTVSCPQRSLGPLVSSIKEFIMFQKMAAKAMEGQGDSRPESGATERLERLVQQLERL